MKKHHYVYYSYEEWGRGYIGCRSCNCLPEEDTKYFGSFRDKTFKPTGKTILFVCETREEAMEIEIKLHNFFDVGFNPQFANKSKATSTRFDVTGVILGPHTEEAKKKISKANTGKIRTEAQKKAQSERMSGENNPNYGVPRTEEWKKAVSERMIGKNVGKTRTEAQKKAESERKTGEKHPQYGRTGALSHRSKAIIVIKPDGTKLHYDSGTEAARELEIHHGSLSRYLDTGHVLTRGPRKGWQFLFKNSEN